MYNVQDLIAAGAEEVFTKPFLSLEAMAARLRELL
jgi:hypothetical protein